MSDFIRFARKGNQPALMQYPTECQPQPAYLELDPAEEEDFLTVDVSGDIGGISRAVMDRLLFRFSIDPYTPKSKLESLDFLELQEAVKELKADWESEWNGSDWVGAMKENAEKSIHDHEMIIQNLIQEALFS